MWPSRQSAQAYEQRSRLVEELLGAEMSQPPVGLLPLYPLCAYMWEPETIIIVTLSTGCVSAKQDARCSGVVF